MGDWKKQPEGETLKNGLAISAVQNSTVNKPSV